MNNNPNTNAANGTVQHFIENMGDLKAFRDSVNNGRDFRNEVVVQNCSFEELKDWEPIGNLDHPFCGTYCGNELPIKNITVRQDSVAGFFGCTRGGILEKIRIESGIISGFRAGGICGAVSSGSVIRQCSNGAVVNGFGNAAFIGGICGESQGQISDCTNTGEIINESDGLMKLTGGIVGSSAGSGIIDGCRNKGHVRAAAEFCGGICGVNNQGTVRYCVNNGMYEGSITQGGICGWNNGAIINCTTSVGSLIGKGLAPVNEYVQNKYVLNEYCKGFAQLKDNCWNYSIIARDPDVDVFTNEYYAGYIQGRLQGEDAIKSARNNTWNNTYLCDTSEPDKKFPKNIDPSEEELETVGKRLNSNYRYLLSWIKENEKNEVALHIKRLVVRMRGIYDGATAKNDIPQEICPDVLDFDCTKFSLAYGDAPLTFGDVYFINAQSDLFDALASSSKEACRGLHKSDHCSAFVKRTADGDIYWTHNTWAGFLCQSHTVSYAIGDEFVTQNAYCPGQFGSNMDFGFNGHGICFNETTHRYGHTEVKEGIWICWRAAAAEMFATDIDDFYRHLTIDNTGTYQNGYMLIDVNTNETALIEMSYRRFVLFRSDGKELKVKDSILGEDIDGKSYDQHLITPDYILGVNYPISKHVAYDLESTDNRPMRRIQFFNQIDGVKDMETAKDLITYVDNDNPLSIYGRWDLGSGITEYPKTIPDGAVDAKVYSAGRVRELLKNLRYTPNENGGKTAFWMLYGTPKIDGKPFVWSESQWAEFKKGQDKDMVPDRLEGAWNETKLFMD